MHVHVTCTCTCTCKNAHALTGNHVQHTWMHIQDIHTCTCTCMCAVHAREVCISHVHIVAVTALASPKRCHPVVAVTTYRIAKHSWALRRPGEQNWPETKNVTWTCPHGHTRNSLYWKTRTPLKRRRDTNTQQKSEPRSDNVHNHLRRHGACTRPASLPHLLSISREPPGLRPCTPGSAREIWISTRSRARSRLRRASC